MKRVIFVRHSKSTWNYDKVDDHDRALSEKGINDARKVAQGLKKHIEKVDEIISSSANRTLHTAVIFTEVLGLDYKKLKINSSLYMMPFYELSEFVKSIDDRHETVIIFTHNPLISIIASKVALMDMKNVPTSGVLDLILEISHWKEFEGKAILKNYITPRNIKTKA